MQVAGASPNRESSSSQQALSRTFRIHCLRKSASPSAWRDQSGQVLPWVALLMLMFLGMCALVVDIGHAMLVQRQLQASADAAALAAAQTLPNSTWSTVGMSYTSAAGSKNAYFGVSVGTPVIAGKCLTTVTSWGIPCSATSPNAVSVTETATIPTFFAEAIGIPTMTLTATSTASKGSKPLPYNVAIILDTTPSMNTKDNNCGGITQLQCATQGVQQLLLGLAPTLDNVSLFTFPNITTTSVSSDYDCSSSNPTVGPYTFPSATATSLSSMPYTTTTGWGWNQTTTTVQETYQVTGWLNNYRSSNAATSLSTTSYLANAVGVGVNNSCTGMQTSNENTYYAAAIYAAQASLIAEQIANPGTQNAIIFLSDGNATAKENSPGGSFSPGSNDMATGSQSTTVATNSGTYPSWVGECGQGVDAAQYAANYTTPAGKADGTTFFSIAYGSPTSSNSGNCGSDRSGGAHQNITPCQAMQQMSSGWPGNTTHFYSDYYAPGGDSGCQASDANNQITSLNNIFQSIVGSLTSSRLIPNNTP